jgi:signal peptidase II
VRTALITIISVIFIDQFVKIWIKTHALLHEVVGSFGFIKFHFIENPGMAFGMAFGGDWGKIVLGVFRVLAIVGLGLIIRNLIENKAHKGLVLSISLIFAGALGNIIDGVLYGYLFDKGTVWDPMLQDWSGYAGVAQANFQGYAGILQGCVVDMIHAEFYYPSWMPFGLAGEEVFPPVFNIADSAISIGIVVIILFNKRFLGENASDFEIFKRKKKSLVE